jgi:hypothetical protein
MRLFGAWGARAGGFKPDNEPGARRAPRAPSPRAARAFGPSAGLLASSSENRTSQVFTELWLSSGHFGVQLEQLSVAPHFDFKAFTVTLRNNNIIILRILFLPGPPLPIPVSFCSVCALNSTASNRLRPRDGRAGPAV